MASAGRVLMIPKGTYDATTTYNMLDLVYYSGATYVCKQTSLNHLPTDTDYWQLVASGIGSASSVAYDNTTSGLVATNVQDALDEIDGRVDKIYPGNYLKLINLGTSYTAELKQDISSGAFEKVMVGGYLTINGHVYYIAALDYWLNTGDTDHVCTTHHAVVVPASSSLVSGKMNSGNGVTGAYAGSDFKTGANSNTALADIKAIIQADFGSANILTHRGLFANAVDGNSASSGWAWADSDIDLMNETMVYGHCVSSKPGTYGHIYEVGIDKSQLELFAKRPDLITTRDDWWLRDVVGSAYFALVYNSGDATATDASTSRGIRPAFAIC